MVKRILVLLVIFVLSFNIAYADTSYYRDLVLHKVADLEDACSIISLFLKIDKDFVSFDERFDELRNKGILPKNIVKKKDMSLRKGVMAHMFFKAMNLKGGWVTRLFGPSQRYALKELVFLEIIKEGSNGQIVGGKELISTLARVSKYMGGI